MGGAYDPFGAAINKGREKNHKRPMRKRTATRASLRFSIPRSLLSAKPGTVGRLQMKKISRLVLAGLSLASAAQPALAALLLEATPLYKDIAHGCRALDLKQWSHPTKRVLDRKQIEIRKVELCNNDVYPIFTVSFRYDPQGPNDAYYNKLFAEMAAANGYHSYSFVDPAWSIIMDVKVTGKNELSISYEDFSPPGNR
jgi:hypothetical protein